MGKDEWLTPPEIISALGVFDLDPCAAEDRPWDTAKKHYTIKENGLRSPWWGRVWLNPPYGYALREWMGRLAEHGNGIALTFARTETKVFFESVWGKAGAIIFLRGRLTFYHSDGTRANNNSGGPSCLIAYGEHNTRVLECCELDGWFIRL
jgi:hypothetical protein